MRRKVKYLNYKIFVPYILLVVLGVILVYSSSSDILLQNGFKPSTYGVKQAIYAAVAFFIFGIPCFALKLEVFKSKKLVMWFLLISLVLLFFLVLMKIFKGSSAAVNGAVGWINLGFINLQPLEVAKLSLVLYLAYVLARRDGKLVKGQIWSNLAHPALMTAIMMALVIVEPDLGGTAILFMIALVMFSVSGIPASLAIKWLLGIIVGVLLVVFLIIMWNPKFLQSNYQFQRLMSFLLFF